MDLSGTLNSVFGVSEPLYLGIAALVALLLAISLSAAVLESVRIYREYYSKEATEEVPEPVLLPEKLPEKTPSVEKAGKVDIASLGNVAAQQSVQAPKPAIEVIKDTLPKSMRVLTAKYGLEWLTIASQDGLVVASTSNTPDEDAAVYSNLFYELHRTRPELYFNVSNKNIHLLLVESDGNKVIDVAKKAGPMTQDETAGLREDTRKVVERFVWSGKKS
jgi:hypothetical protein